MSDNNNTVNNTVKVLSDMFMPLRQSGKFMLVNAFVCSKYGARNFAIFASPSNKDKQAQVDVAIAVKSAMDSGDWSAFEHNASIPNGQAGVLETDEEQAPAATPSRTPIMDAIPVAQPATTPVAESKKPSPKKEKAASKVASSANADAPADNVIEMPKVVAAPPASSEGDRGESKDPINTLAEMIVDVMAKRGLVRVNANGQIDAIGPDDAKLRKIIDRVCFQEARRAVRQEMARVLSQISKELSSNACEEHASEHGKEAVNQ